jgi:hypothetical protein
VTARPAKRPDGLLTPDHIAASLERAAYRTLRILMEARQTDGLEEIHLSPQVGAGLLEALAWELQQRGIEPRALRPDGLPPKPKEALSGYTEDEGESDSPDRSAP